LFSALAAFPALVRQKLDDLEMAAPDEEPEQPKRFIVRMLVTRTLYDGGRLIYSDQVEDHLVGRFCEIPVHVGRGQPYQVTRYELAWTKALGARYEWASGPHLEPILVRGLL
jgi:hypothetical protein